MTPTDAGPAAPNPQQLRHDIDAGRTGDKVGGIDPAAAPLGTDAEAGGVTPDPQLVARDRAQENPSPERPSTRENAATPELAPDARLPRQRGLAWAAVAGVLVALALALFLYLRL